MAKVKTVTIEGVGERHLFWCAGCKTHMWFQTDPDRLPYWTWNGHHEKPTVTPSIRSFDLEGTTCHIYVRDGQIQFLGDCKHELAGQTIPMEECRW